MSANTLSASHARRCFARIAVLHYTVTLVAWHLAVNVMISSNAMDVRKDTAWIAEGLVLVNVATKPDAMIAYFITLVNVAIPCLIVSSVLTLTTSSGAIFARKNTAMTVA